MKEDIRFIPINYLLKYEIYFVIITKLNYLPQWWTKLLLPFVHILFINSFGPPTTNNYLPSTCSSWIYWLNSVRFEPEQFELYSSLTIWPPYLSILLSSHIWLRWLSLPASPCWGSWDSPAFIVVYNPVRPLHSLTSYNDNDI